MPAVGEQPAAASPSLGSIARFAPVVDGVGRLATVFVNLYVVDLPDGSWVLVDTGIPGSAWYVLKAIAARYGADARPAAIVLTHAHFDHAGNAKALADAWDVPAYVHERELPYVTGNSDYAPADPTPGGAICEMSRAMPASGTDLGDRVKILPADGNVPPMPGWRWLATPGHTAGHVALIRDADRVALVGDTLATFDMDSWAAHLTWTPQIARPATPFTPDWIAARKSIVALADAEPTVIAAGHGVPIGGDDLAGRLATFADAMPEPAGGRYADDHPAKYAADGALSNVPPPVSDPVKYELIATAAVVGLAAVALGIWATTRHDDDAAAD